MRKTAMPPPFAPATARPQRQRGVALFVVIVFVMLSMLLALWASRTSLFNEMVVGNDADYQRAFEAAQALLQDAELDIRGETAGGQPCSGQPCRAYTSALKFPAEDQDIPPLIDALNAEATKCKDGICTRRLGRQDFWNYDDDAVKTPANPQASLGEVPLKDLAKKGIAARFGQYTGAKTGDASAPINPILAIDDDSENGYKKGGWYWIEVMPYSQAAKYANLIVDADSNRLPLHLDVYVVYRITALAYGMKENTKVVLQQTYARQRQKN